MVRTNIRKPKEAILFGISAIYLFAFASLYIQLPGIVGDDGLLPVRLLKLSQPSTFEDFLKMPSLVTFSNWAKLSAYNATELLVIAGAILSLAALFSKAFRTMPVFFLLWICYLSVYKVGQAFLFWQWDLLLLEAGFLTILLAPLHNFGSRDSQSDYISMWLMKWLLFRLMFASGVVKLSRQCPSWWSLTALNVHFESECIPNPLAWYAHQLPEWFLKLSVAATLIIELPLPYLFFVPLKLVRWFSFIVQVLLQVAIILTGNFNFFNMLTIVLCISLLTDEELGRPKRHQRGVVKFFNFVVSCILIGGVMCVSSFLFGIRVSGNKIESKIMFTYDQFDEVLGKVMYYVIPTAFVLMGFQLLYAIYRSIKIQGGITRSTEFLRVLLIGTIALMIFTCSLVPLTRLHQASSDSLQPQVKQLAKSMQPLELTHPYGLFSRMTGVGGRPEIVIEGAMLEGGPWKEYEFWHKPGSVERKPSLCVPHQPRLDWQMWLAALGTYDKHPVLANLVFRLLTNQKEVIQLFANNPFPEGPKFIRIQSYIYRYAKGTPATHWWNRSLKGTYLAATSVKDKKLRQATEATGIVGKRRERPFSPTLVSIYLEKLRENVGQPKDIYPLLVVILVLHITKTLLSKCVS